MRKGVWTATYFLFGAFISIAFLAGVGLDLGDRERMEYQRTLIIPTFYPKLGSELELEGFRHCLVFVIQGWVVYRRPVPGVPFDAIEVASQLFERFPPATLCARQTFVPCPSPCPPLWESAPPFVVCVQVCAALAHRAPTRPPLQDGAQAGPHAPLGVGVGAARTSCFCQLYRHQIFFCGFLLGVGGGEVEVR